MSRTEGRGLSLEREPGEGGGGHDRAAAISPRAGVSMTERLEVLGEDLLESPSKEQGQESGGRQICKLWKGNARYRGNSRGRGSRGWSTGQCP